MTRWRQYSRHFGGRLCFAGVFKTKLRHHTGECPVFERQCLQPGIAMEADMTQMLFRIRQAFGWVYVSRIYRVNFQLILKHCGPCCANPRYGSITGRQVQHTGFFRQAIDMLTPCTRPFNCHNVVLFSKFLTKRLVLAKLLMKPGIMF